MKASGELGGEGDRRNGVLNAGDRGEEGTLELEGVCPSVRDYHLSQLVSRRPGFGHQGAFSGSEVEKTIDDLYSIALATVL